MLFCCCHLITCDAQKMSMKLFRTGDINIAKSCQSYFSFNLPSVLLKNRADKFDITYNKMLSYRRATALQEAHKRIKFWPEMEDWKWETLRIIISLYSTTVTYLASKAIEFGEKRKIRAITPFKVIEVRTNRKPVYATSY